MRFNIFNEHWIYNVLLEELYFVNAFTEDNIFYQRFKFIITPTNG